LIWLIFPTREHVLLMDCDKNSVQSW